MASVEAKAEAQVSVSGGVRAHANLKGGVEWDTNRGVYPISSFDYQYEVVKPEVEAEAHAEAKAYVWPQINIGIYDVLCPTINPKPYVRAYADARTAEANKPFFGWNAGVSTGVDLTLGLNLDLYFWKKEIGEIDPINLIDYDLVAVPTKIEIDDAEHLTRNVMQGDTCHVKYRVKGINHITGSEYNIPLACVKIEKNGGGEIDSEQWKGADYFYTNMDGEIDVVYTQTDTIPAVLKATLITGDEERDREAKEWKTIVYDYRLTAPDADASDNSINATIGGKAEAKFLLEQYIKNDADKDGVWFGLGETVMQFEATNGELEDNSVETDREGYAIANFDGGKGFGGGSLTAKVYIEEFDTLLTKRLIIHKFSFEDSDLAKCYNLSNNTALLNGDEFTVKDLTNDDWEHVSTDHYIEKQDSYVWDVTTKQYVHQPSVFVRVSALKLYGDNGPTILVKDTTYVDGDKKHHDRDEYRSYKKAVHELEFKVAPEQICYWQSGEDCKEYGWYEMSGNGIHTLLKHDYRYETTYKNDKGETETTVDEGTYEMDSWSSWITNQKLYRDNYWMQYRSHGKAFVFEEGDNVVILICLKQDKSNVEDDPADQTLYLKAVYSKNDERVYGF
jgi:hypothetical protein